MSYTIVVASGKGGVGKSTTASAIGQILASKGKKVLLIDCDAGLSSLDIMLKTAEKTVFSWYDVNNGDCSADEAITRVSENLSLLTAPSDVIFDGETNEVQNVTEMLTEKYDFIIRDAPAGLGTGLKRAAYKADLALVLATADTVSVKGAAAVADALRKSGISNTRLIINRYDIKAAQKGRLLTVDELIDKSFVRLLGIVPEDKSITYSTVIDVKNKKSKSPAAFERISDRLLGKNVDLILALLK